MTKGMGQGMLFNSPATDVSPQNPDEQPILTVSPLRTEG